MFPVSVGYERGDCGESFEQRNVRCKEALYRLKIFKCERYLG